MQEKTIEIMMRLIRCAMTKEPIPESLRSELSDGTLKKLFLMSKLYDLAHLLDFAFENSDFQYREDIQLLFQEQTMRAVYRYDAFAKELEAISKTFEEAKIEYILLKGSEIRKLYPEPWMRTSCDIDVLIKKEEIDRAAKALTDRLGYRSNAYSTHDVSFVSKDQVHIELHFDLSQDNALEKADPLLADIWSYTVRKPGSSCLQLTSEMFYLYHLAHTAKHFKNGGCGVRPVLDIWLLRQNGAYRTQETKNLIRRAGLADFAAAFEKLSEVWFDQAEHDEITRKIQQYIFSGDKYSGVKNRVAVSGSRKEKEPSKGRIWKPYDELKYWYPALAKHKWLLPFYQFRRWLRILFGVLLTRKRKEDQIKKKTDSNKITETADLLKSLGI